MLQETKGWDTSYEWKIILLLSLTFGLVGLDRFILPVLFPAFMEELNLTYEDLGNLVGILAVFWGIFVIGSTGVMLWFPETFTRVLPVTRRCAVVTGTISVSSWSMPIAAWPLPWSSHRSRPPGCRWSAVWRTCWPSCMTRSRRRSSIRFWWCPTGR